MSALSRQEKLETLLSGFHLPSFTQHYQQYAREAEKQKIDHVGYLYQLAQVESEERYNRRTERLLKQSKLPKSKLLEDFNFSRFPDLSESTIKKLADGNCLDKAENVLIFGNPGTGKTHLAAALAREWCLKGRKVFFTTASNLVQDLLTAKRDLRMNALLKRLENFEALLIDDISYIPQTREETDVLFILLAERYERRSLVITSNLPFSKWDTIFKDAVTTMAAVDRLVHHSTVLELNGESFRMQAAKKRKKKEDEN